MVKDRSKKAAKWYKQEGAKGRVIFFFKERIWNGISLIPRKKERVKTQYIKISR